MTDEPTRVVDSRCHTGEGPLWHPDEERLYWVDIPNGRLYRYDPESGNHEQCYETDTIGGFTLEADGALLLFEDEGRVERWTDGTTHTLVEGIERERDSRFNDVVADPRGRVFCGTMPTDAHLGGLYRLDTDGSLTRLGSGYDIPNGMGFSPADDILYVAETTPGRIHAFEYDETTGDISNRETFVDVAAEQGNPDGLTVDAEGFVWSAQWNGGCLVRYAPDGTESRRIEFPARKVSSLAFAGAEDDDAYVTTAFGPAEGPAGERDTEGDGAGAVFRFRPETGGVPEYRSRVG